MVGEQGDVGGRQSGDSQAGLGQVQIPTPIPFTSLHLPPPKLSPLPPPPKEARGVPTVSPQRFGSVPTPG